MSRAVPSPSIGEKSQLDHGQHFSLYQWYILSVHLCRVVELSKRGLWNPATLPNLNSLWLHSNVWQMSYFGCFTVIKLSYVFLEFLSIQRWKPHMSSCVLSDCVWAHTYALSVFLSAHTCVLSDCIWAHTCEISVCISSHIYLCSLIAYQPTHVSCLSVYLPTYICALWLRISQHTWAVCLYIIPHICLLSDCVSAHTCGCLSVYQPTHVRFLSVYHPTYIGYIIEEPQTRSKQEVN